MLRRIVQHGPSTMTVSLPVKWIKRNNVCKGDEVDVKDENNRITINIEKESGKKIAKVDITGLSRSAIMFYLRSLYRQGFDEIMVKYSNQTTIHHDTNETVRIISVIHHEIGRLIGFEITQQREGFCVLKDLTGMAHDNVDIVLKRIFFLFKDTISDAAQALKSKNLEALETIEERHDTITKFISYALRFLNKSPDAPPERINGIYHILCSMDLGIDIIKYFSRYIFRNKIEFSEKGIMLIEKLQELSTLTREIFFNFSLEKVIRFMELRAEVKNMLDDALLLGNCKETYILFYIAPTIELMRDMVETKMAITAPKDVSGF